MLRRALAIDEAHSGIDHQDVTRDLNNLFSLLFEMQRYEEAEPLIRRALSIDESRFGELHARIAVYLHNLAQLLVRTHHPDEAEPLARRALAIDQVNYGDCHPNVAIRLNGLGVVLQARRDLNGAEQMLRRALSMLVNCCAATGYVDHYLWPVCGNLRRLLVVRNRAEESIDTDLAELLRPISHLLAQ